MDCSARRRLGDVFLGEYEGPRNERSTRGENNRNWFLCTWWRYVGRRKERLLIQIITDARQWSWRMGMPKWSIITIPIRLVSFWFKNGVARCIQSRGGMSRVGESEATIFSGCGNVRGHRGTQLHLFGGPANGQWERSEDQHSNSSLTGVWNDSYLFPWWIAVDGVSHFRFPARDSVLPVEEADPREENERLGLGQKETSRKVTIFQNPR